MMRKKMGRGNREKLGEIDKERSFSVLFRRFFEQGIDGGDRVHTVVDRQMIRVK